MSADESNCSPIHNLEFTDLTTSAGAIIQLFLSKNAEPHERNSLLNHNFVRIFKDINNMFILSNFMHSLATVVDIVLNLYIWILIARAVLSWVNPDPYNPIVKFLYNITEPLMYRVRRIFPLQFGGIDLTPMVIILAIIFLRSFIVPTLHQLANQIS